MLQKCKSEICFNNENGFCNTRPVRVTEDEEKNILVCIRFKTTEKRGRAINNLLIQHSVVKID